MSAFRDFKVMIIGLTGLPRDALHIYVGLGVFLLVALALRKPLGSWLPLAAVALVAVTGELMDLGDDRPHVHWSLGESAHDILHTMLWPAVLTLLARARWLKTAG